MSDKLPAVLALFVLSIGVLDSLNPSTIGPALYLATRTDAHRSLARFTVGVFVTSLLCGLVLTLGPGQIVLAALPRPGRQTKHLLELCLGLAVLVVAIVLWFSRERVARRIDQDELRIDHSSLLLGAGIIVVELPTAFPYFAVIAAIVGSQADVVAQLGLLVLFNAAFVAPLLAIVAIRRLAGARGERTLATWRVEVHRHAAVLIPALVLVIAIALMAFGAVGIAG